MSAVDIKRLARMAWQRTKRTEAAGDDDPVMEHVEGKVVRAIAELEVVRLRRQQQVSAVDAVPIESGETQSPSSISDAA